METFKAIKLRRSIRKFKDQEIDDEDLLKILDAATYAPASGNIKHIKFVVIEDKETKKNIAKAALDQNWITTAPIIIIACSESVFIEQHYGKRGKELYAIQNVAAAIENMLIAASDLGISGCWVGAFTEPMLRSVLGIPDDVEIHAIIPLGYADESPKFRHKLHATDITFYEKWGTHKRPGLLPLGESPIVEKKISEVKKKLKNHASKLKKLIKNSK